MPRKTAMSSRSRSNFCIGSWASRSASLASGYPQAMPNTRWATNAESVCVRILSVGSLGGRP